MSKCVRASLLRRLFSSRPCRGNYADYKTGPWEGLKQAREYGTLFYRSREEYDARFNCATGRDGGSAEAPGGGWAE